MSSPKPTFQVRPPPTPAAVEAFVAGGQPSAANVQAPSRQPPAASRRRRGIVTRAGGVERARLTVYVSPDVAERLRRWAFEHGAELSDVAAAAIEAHVAALGDGT